MDTGIRIREIARVVKRWIRYIKDSIILIFSKGRRFALNAKDIRVYVMGTEDFGNLGDHHIAISEIQFLKKYYKNVIEVTVSEYYKMRGKLIWEIRESDVIVMTGGGNFGNIYPLAQEIKRDIIRFWKNNVKLIMPQTIFYSSDENGSREKDYDKTIFSRQNYVILAAREWKSFEDGKNLFDCLMLLTPDIVLSSCYTSNKARENRAIFCIRNDMESALSDTVKNDLFALLVHNFKDVQKYDTQKDYLIAKEERSFELNKSIQEFLAAKLVITDRLHGMIFSVITSTPCIVLGNFNHKIEGSYQWVQELPYIQFTHNLSEVEECLKGKFWKEEYHYEPEMFDKQYYQIIDVLKKSLSEMNAENNRY